MGSPKIGAPRPPQPMAVQAVHFIGEQDGPAEREFTGDEHFGGMTFKGRVTMKVLSPTSYTIKFELSQNGTQWFPAVEGKAAKK